MISECDLLCIDSPTAKSVADRLPPAEQLSMAADFAKSFGEPNRVSIAVALQSGGELCGCDLSVITGLPQNLVSHHLAVLRRAGVTVARRNGKLVMHRLTGEGEALLAVVGDSAGLAISPPGDLS